ncbi:methyltransferase domain-containing protein [Halomonas sp. FME1]|uniref:Methyltransferase domain-containing protein n=1 Tax=Halomonas casei TaxID=2742613 RepID=A0ABR9F3U6_9GAMM|nr:MULTISPECIES: class I SAM-dependent methyltransferase [Halomonas]MBE0401138.1 methyltransferase domain-containing protein [Halomonas casei]PCC21983.1 SAM-dependent methyltransferase [Halomonas sp. JB37]
MTHTPQQNAPGQKWNASGYAENADFVPKLGGDVLKLLSPQAGESILDLGCGDGALTERLVQLGANVLGVDASEDMVNATRQRGISAQIVDAHQLDFDHEFDAVFSNAALHWMLDPQPVLVGVKRALKPGGRLVAEFGGHGNVAAICTALIAALHLRGISIEGRHPWYFPTPTEYTKQLERAGFEVESIALIPRPTPLPTGMAGWLKTFASPFMHGLDESVREAVLEDTLMLLEHSLRDEQGNWTADYVRLRVSARA